MRPAAVPSLGPVSEADVCAHGELLDTVNDDSGNLRDCSGCTHHSRKQTGDGTISLSSPNSEAALNTSSLGKLL
jgi:hypothetical protein